jgi:hypothetical protein
MPDLNDPRLEPDNLGLPPLAPLANDDNGLDDPPHPPLRRPRRKAVPAPDSLIDQTEEDARIAALLGDDENSDAQVEISRKTPDNKWAFCTVVALTDWSSESKIQIANEFGGGKYRASVRRSNKTFAATFHFEVDASVKPRSHSLAAPAFNMQELIAQLRPQQGGDPGFMQLMQAQQAMMMQFMQMQAQQSAESMKALAQVMARPVTPAAPVNDKLVEVLLAKALDNRSSGPDLPKLIEAVARLREVAGGAPVADSDDKDGDDNNDIFGGVIKALPGIVNLISQGAANSHAAASPNPPLRARLPARPQPVSSSPSPAPASPPPAPSASAAPESAAPVTGVKINREVLAMFLPQVVDLAKNGTSVAEAVNTISDALDPTGQTEVLVELLRSPDWLNHLIDAHRPVMGWTKWFGELRQAFLERAKPAPAEDVEIVSG